MKGASTHPADEPLYSQSEAAHRLRISISTLKRIRSRGEIGYFRIGGNVFFCDDQINEFKEKAERPADR